MPERVQWFQWTPAQTRFLVPDPRSTTALIRADSRTDPTAGLTADPTADSAVSELVALLRRRRVAVLSGAGCSTESGIPDYRGPDGRFRAREPMRYGEFMGSPEARRRYWARSAVGWTRFAAARPNPAHEALARLEAAGAVSGVITQNVDGLHQAAGSREVVELHGSLATVRCMDCGDRMERAAIQEHLLELNPALAGASLPGGGGSDPSDEGSVPGGEVVVEADGIQIAPDGDADVPDALVRNFRVPVCLYCDGLLKPDVVFFGENVPRAKVEAAWEVFEASDALLIVGSSLAVFSGRRFAYRAEKDGVPVAIVNVGHTRADEMARIKVEKKVGLVLPRLADGLERRENGRDGGKAVSGRSEDVTVGREEVRP